MVDQLVLKLSEKALKVSTSNLTTQCKKNHQNFTHQRISYSSSNLLKLPPATATEQQLTSTRPMAEGPLSHGRAERQPGPGAFGGRGEASRGVAQGGQFAPREEGHGGHG